MIRSLISALREAGYEPDDIDVADMLWLAHGMSESVATENAAATEKQMVDPQDQIAKEATTHVSEAPNWKPAEKTQRSSTQRTQPHSAPTGSFQSSDSVEHIAAPTSPALPERLDIARALRPFMRHRDSDHFSDFDVEATVNQFADTGFLYPVMRPGKERWFDVALVVDESTSMIVWEETVDELVGVFGRQGAFRDVHRWSLREEDGRAVVRNESGVPTDTHNVVDPGGRRLVLMVTDCVAEFWYRPTIWRLLQQWGKLTPVSIVQVLPTRIWPATGLGLANIDLRGARPGAPNSQQHIDLPFWLDEPSDNLEAIPIPAISLDANAIGDWAKVTMGSGTVSGRAVVKTFVEGEYPDNADHETRSPSERLAAFRAKVSFDAWELTTYLSVVPLRLGVMRLVQEAMMPHTGHAELAEFLIGGLVRRVAGEQQVLNGSELEFEFVDGLRELLNEAVDQAQTLKVYRSIAYHLERTEGSSPGFSALILGQDIEADSLPEFLRPFVSVGQGVLQRKGLINFEPGDGFSRASGNVESESTENEVPPVWDGALVVGVSHYENLSPLDDPTQTAEQFGDWLRSSPGPGVPEDRVRVLKNPQNNNDILRVLEELDATVPIGENEDRMLVLAFFGHTITYGDQSYFCLPGFSREDIASNYLFNPEGSIDKLMRDGNWRRYLCIVDGGPDDLRGSEEERLLLQEIDPPLQKRSSESGGLMLSRKSFFRKPFLPEVLNASNIDARDFDGQLHGPDLAEHLDDVAYHKTFGTGVGLLLDETSEIKLDKESDTQPAPIGINAALVIGAGDSESLFDAGLISTWLRHPDGINMNPGYIWQINNPESAQHVSETVKEIDLNVEDVATLLVYVTGEVIMGEDGVHLSLGESRSAAPIKLHQLSRELSQLQSFTSVVLVLSVQSNENVQFDLSSALPEFPDNVLASVPIFHLVVRDRERHSFARAFIGSFSASYTSDLGNESVEFGNEKMMTTQTIYERVTDPQELRVWFNKIEPIELGTQLPESATVVRVLSRESTFVCEHGRGRVVLPAGNGPLLFKELIGAPIEGCTLKGETGGECTKVIGTDEFGIGGEFESVDSSLLFDTVRAFSDGAPSLFPEDVDHEFYSDAQAIVRLDKASYVNVVDLSSRDFKARVEQQQPQTTTSKWPAVALTIDLIATREGSSVLLGRPRLERDSVYLFGLGDVKSFEQVLRPRFDLLAQNLGDKETFQIDVLAVNATSDSDVKNTVSMLDAMSERLDNHERPLFNIDDLWYNTIEELRDSKSPKFDSKAAFAGERFLLQHLVKLNINRNHAFKGREIRRWQKFHLGGKVSVTVLGPKSPSGNWDSSPAAPSSPMMREMILLIECDSRRVLLSGESDFSTINGSFQDESIEADEYLVDVWQLPIPSEDLYSDDLESSGLDVFYSVIADHYLIPGNGSFAIEWTMNLFRELLRARQDQRTFTVHFAFHPEEFNADFPVEDLIKMFEEHGHAKLEFPKPGAGYTSIDLLAPLPNQEEQQPEPQ